MFTTVKLFYNARRMMINQLPRSLRWLDDTLSKSLAIIADNLITSSFFVILLNKPLG